MTVCIVGAGVTGLTAAYLLRRRGVPVQVFEASAQAGGLAGTFEHDGFFFDYGPHEFCTDNPELEGLLAEVCGEDLRRVTKRTTQCFNGRFVKYPFEVVDVIKNIPPGLTFRAFMGMTKARLTAMFRGAPETSFESWTRARFGHTLYDIYFGPYTKKVWGITPSELDARTATQRITVDSIWDLAKKWFSYHFLGSDEFKKTHSEFRHDFLYTRRGTGTLQAHLRRRAENLGAQFSFRKRLTKLDIYDGKIHRLRFSDGTTAEGFSNVISTIPLPSMVRLARPSIAEELLARNALPFRGMIFLFLRVNRPKVTDNHWIYFADEDVPFQRLTEFVHFEADMAPEGQTGLALEVAADPGDENWERPDEDIVNDCLRKMSDLGLDLSKDLLGWDVARVRHAYPVQVRGYQEKADALLDALEPVRNLVSIGRQGLFRYCNQNECMEMAIDLVPQILDGKESMRYTHEGTWQGVGITDRYRVKEQ